MTGFDWLRGDVEQVLIAAADLLSGTDLPETRMKKDDSTSKDYDAASRNVCEKFSLKQKIRIEHCYKPEEVGKWGEACKGIMRSIYEDYEKAHKEENKAPKYDDFLKNIRVTLNKQLDFDDPAQTLEVWKKDLPGVFPPSTGAETVQATALRQLDTKKKMHKSSFLQTSK